MERRTLACLLVAAAMALTGAAAAETDPPALSWVPCPVDGGATELECASLEVPVDWADPDGRTITLDLARAPATGPARSGAVLMNPGGPGSSGITSLNRWIERFD